MTKKTSQNLTTLTMFRFPPPEASLIGQTHRQAGNMINTRARTSILTVPSFAFVAFVIRGRYHISQSNSDRISKPTTTRKPTPRRADGGAACGSHSPQLVQRGV